MTGGWRPTPEAPTRNDLVRYTTFHQPLTNAFHAPVPAPSTISVGAPSAEAVKNFMTITSCMSKQVAPGSDAAHACLFRPATQFAACAAQLNATQSWPNATEMADAQRIFQNLSMVIVGDSTLETKALVLDKVLSVNSSCHQGNGHCFVRAGKQRVEHTPKACPLAFPARTDFDVVLYNAGMHFLSPVYANRPSFSGYFSALRSCAASLRERYPNAMPVYMLTNRICVDNFRGAYADNALRMRDRTEEFAYNMQWSDLGVEHVRIAEREVAHEQGWLVLDAFTGHHCECSGQRDGRHFLPLVPRFLVRLAALADKAPRNTTHNVGIGVSRALGE